MKKSLLFVFGGILASALTINAQTVQTFDGTSVPTGWAPEASYTLAANNRLEVTMNDSVGPQQMPLAASPASNWQAIIFTPAASINMAQGCKCITFDVDNTGNQVLVLAVQAQDVNHVVGTNNKYTDQTNAVIAAGYVGSVTINYTGKFENYYGYPTAGGKIDSTQVAQINIQAIGEGLPAAPWSKKYKGNFKIDNLSIAGLTLSNKKAAEYIATSKVYPNPVSETANLELTLKSVSDVKVTLSDMMGKEMMTVANGSYSSLNESFSVANLNKGIYTVNYFVNGAAAKSELLMVK
jgi:hypothetical protein